MNSEILNCVKEFMAKHKLDITKEGVVIENPYAPHIPSTWDKTLVLAEAQNLSINHDSYVAKLKSYNFQDQVFRLKNPNDLGILPWDDHSLKVAVEVGMGSDHREVAVSNACFWSQRNNKGNNASPSENLQRLSSLLWEELLKTIKPKVIISIGKIAKNIICSTTMKDIKHLNLCHPSSNYLSRFSGLVTEETILSRFPEIKKLDSKYPGWMTKGNYRQNKLFYAIHALSKLK